MFSFINEFLNDNEIETESSLKNNFKYANFNNRIFYFQNFKDILTFSCEEIVLKLFNGEVSISGKELKIKEISKNFIVISGIINKIEVINAN